MAYEQFYRAGCLLIYYILTNLWYHFGQSDLLDIKMELAFLSRRYFKPQRIFYKELKFHTIVLSSVYQFKSSQKLDPALGKHDFFFFYTSCKHCSECLSHTLKKRKTDSYSGYTSKPRLPLYSNIYLKI